MVESGVVGMWAWDLSFPHEIGVHMWIGLCFMKVLTDGTQLVLQMEGVII